MQNEIVSIREPTTQDNGVYSCEVENDYALRASISGSYVLNMRGELFFYFKER